MLGWQGSISSSFQLVDQMILWLTALMAWLAKLKAQGVPGIAWLSGSKLLLTVMSLVKQHTSHSHPPSKPHWSLTHRLRHRSIRSKNSVWHHHIPQLATMSLEEQFKAAADEALKLPDGMPNEDKLALYALFKQGSVGDCNTGEDGT